MSYLQPPSTRAAYRLPKSSIRGLRHYVSRLGAIKNFRTFQLRGLNNGSTTVPDCSATDPATGGSYGQAGVYCTATLPPQGPTIQDVGNPLTVAGAPVSSLNYVSPQAAVAAGLNPTDVTNEWTQALAVFPTAQAAVDAGVPAGVVTQLFVASRSFITKPAAPPPVWPLLAAAALGALIVNDMGKGH